MAHIPPPNEAEQPGGLLEAIASAGLIRVPASAQQNPGAIRSCPVCGQPYAADSQPVGQQAGLIAADARLVLRCAHCKTYSVGTLDGTGEAGE